MATTFAGEGAVLTSRGVAEACSLTGADAAAIWSVLSVESLGFGFLRDRRPVILFERHIFRRLTDARFDASYPALSNATPGGYLGGAAEYPRVSAAMQLDRDAALESTSWGIGQVMGFNYAVAGYSSGEAMVNAICGSEDAQLIAAACVMRSSGVAGPLRLHQWPAVASRYNGPEQAGSDYATKLAAAYERFALRLPDLDVRALQAKLLYAGYDPGPVDGVVGVKTEKAAAEYRKKERAA